MLTQRRSLLAALTFLAVLASAYSARATSVELIATPFTGDDTSVRILLDDAGGNITVTLTVNEGLADLRGFYLNVDDGLSASLEDVTGDDVTHWEAGSVINLGHGNNLHGGGSPCPCDIGVALGTPGIGKDDLFSTTFLLDFYTDVTLDDFAGEFVGVRVTSVGGEEDGREGSAKLAVAIPEPSTAFLLVLGLGALSYAGRSRR